MWTCSRKKQETFLESLSAAAWFIFSRGIYSKLSLDPEKRLSYLLYPALKIFYGFSRVVINDDFLYRLLKKF